MSRGTMESLAVGADPQRCFGNSAPHLCRAWCAVTTGAFRPERPDMKSVPSETSIHDSLKAVASAEETHGAVSVAAVAGGLGTSLLLVIATLPKTRSDSVQDRAKLIEAATALTDVQEQLMETIETETAVKIFAARNLPQASAAQRSERQAAIQIAFRPLQTCPSKCCAGALAD